MHIPVLHPNPEKSNLPPSPLLLVATSDGCIRSYTLGSTTEPPIVQPARPIPQPAYLQSLPAVVRIFCHQGCFHQCATLPRIDSYTRACTQFGTASLHDISLHWACICYTQLADLLKVFCCGLHLELIDTCFDTSICTSALLPAVMSTSTSMILQLAWCWHAM